MVVFYESHFHKSGNMDVSVLHHERAVQQVNRLLNTPCTQQSYGLMEAYAIDNRSILLSYLVQLVQS